MAQPSRRKFLAAAGAGAAGVAAVGIAGTAATSALSSSAPASSTGASPQLPKLPEDASGSLVAYVTDVRAGRVSLLVGENRVEINDHDLVARLAHAAHPAGSEV